MILMLALKPLLTTLLCVFLTGRPARIISGQSARNIHKNKSCKLIQTKNTSDRVIFRSKTHKILKFSEHIIVASVRP